MLVITGGPGAGKTTLIDALADHGFSTVAESGRAILQFTGGMKLRARDPSAYAMAMLKHDQENFDRAQKTNNRYVFDRGFPDIAGYLNLMSIKAPQQLNLACSQKRYSGPIFAAPPWPEIYENDTERTQDLEMARATYNAVTDAWKYYGYELTSLPLTTVEKRVDFVLDKLN